MGDLGGEAPQKNFDFLVPNMTHDDASEEEESDFKEELKKSCFLKLFEQTYFWSWIQNFLLSSKKTYVNELETDEQ